MKNLKISLISAIALAAATVGTAANAAVDAAVTTAITAAGTDLGTVYSALTVVGASLWVARLIYRKFSVR